MTSPRPTHPTPVSDKRRDPDVNPFNYLRDSKTPRPPISTVSRRSAMRTITIGGALAAFPALLGCTPSEQRIRATSGEEPARDTVIMVIRHGEKPAKSQPPLGIDLSGRPDVHSLTTKGWTRAHYLVDLFSSAEPGRVSLPSPKSIYASGRGSADEGTRPRETVGPLAAALNIPVDTTFSRGQETALANEVTRQSAPALICWQHESIPAIAAALHPVAPVPPTVWPDDRYDVVWAFTRAASGWQFQQVPELLLPNDSDTGI